jgi:hypothetical protein
LRPIALLYLAPLKPRNRWGKKKSFGVKQVGERGEKMKQVGEGGRKSFGILATYKTLMQHEVMEPNGTGGGKGQAKGDKTC